MIDSHDSPLNPSFFTPLLPQRPGERHQWGQLPGAALALAVSQAVRRHAGLVVVVTPEARTAEQLRQALRFFLDETTPVLDLPDWETLPYDVFSPLPETISRRLLTLYRLPGLDRGVLVVAAAVLLQRLLPRRYLDAHALILAPGDRLVLGEFRQRLAEAGYQGVSQVLAHGEFAVRGSLLDLFPAGEDTPYRIDLLDDEVDSLRRFDPETQRSLAKVSRIRLLPAREFPLDEAGIGQFRQGFRSAFPGDPQKSPVYRDVSAGLAPAGIEYYLPLFFETTASLFDYLPAHSLLMMWGGLGEAIEAFLTPVRERYELCRFDSERPILEPKRLYLTPEEVHPRFEAWPSVHLSDGIQERRRGFAQCLNFPARCLPAVGIDARAAHPGAALQEFVEGVKGRGEEEGSDRFLFMAESAGRREMLLGNLQGLGLRPVLVDGWPGFLASPSRLALTVGPLEQGLLISEGAGHLTILTETELFGERVRQERRRKVTQRDTEQVIRNLTELSTGSPVVHEQHGVGRYLGLQTLTAGGLATEFLTLEYAGGDKLYVPVSSLHLISRYTGVSPDSAPLHKLGGDQWAKIKRKATERLRDVAVELLDLYARRAAHAGHAFPDPGPEYATFAAAFPFEETPDQQAAITAVLQDLQTPQPMDRVVCGDVGFGKTEVAMRAAFVAVQAGRQVAVLVPTTLLADQHFRNFADRLADWPIRIEGLSRFRTDKEQRAILAGLADGRVDILIGTHKLLQPDVRFKNLGLVIVDEEHRFGVRHKERLKALRSEVDLLTLTATPIPRTLNMAMAGLRDLSIIATPPAGRHPIKTFVSPWSDALIVEACQRELKRGGQVYFLHNEVKTIAQQAETLARLVPQARIQVAHGQMRERELERIMRDFYHQRFNLLVCTTIIESGIDVPSANTMIIHRADKLGLAQLHQLRGRVGRSHHRAYAYLIAPPTANLTADAAKRLEAIAALEDLGAGFTLATHDLEIRGAGELLGEEQSGQIQEIGFTLYMELLDRTVQALKSGRQLALDAPAATITEVDLQIPALLPADYLPDVHGRLVLYKRIASARDPQGLEDLQVEMIDRFGLLPEAAKNLFAVTELKLAAQPLGIRKIEAGPQGGRLLFDPTTPINPARLVGLLQKNPKTLKLEGGDRLRFSGEFSTAAERIAEVKRLLKALGGGA
ncbi:MAG: transcription-repair coupling factor [Pseudomonadota bacterium]